MDSESNEAKGGERRPRTVLPPRRQGASRKNPFPGADREIVPAGKPETGNEVLPVDELPPPREERREDEDRPDDLDEIRAEEGAPGMVPLIPPGRGRGGPKKFNVIFFSAVLPVLVFSFIIFMVIKLDQPKSGIEPVDGGKVYWFADGLIAVQFDPDSEKKVYYLIEAPRDAEPRIRFEDRLMTLVVRTEAGTKDLGRSVDWEEAPYAMLISYLDLYGETPKVPCTPELIDGYLESVGEGATMAPLANQLRVPVQPAP